MKSHSLRINYEPICRISRIKSIIFHRRQNRSISVCSTCNMLIFGIELYNCRTVRQDQKPLAWLEFCLVSSLILDRFCLCSFIFFLFSKSLIPQKNFQIKGLKMDCSLRTFWKLWIDFSLCIQYDCLKYLNANYWQFMSFSLSFVLIFQVFCLICEIQVVIICEALVR